MLSIAFRATTERHTTQPLPSSARERARAPCHTPHASTPGSAPGVLHQELPPGAVRNPRSTRDENGSDSDRCVTAWWSARGLTSDITRSVAPGVVTGALSPPSQLPAPRPRSPSHPPSLVRLHPILTPITPISFLLAPPATSFSSVAGVYVSMHLDGNSRYDTHTPSAAASSVRRYGSAAGKAGESRHDAYLLLADPVIVTRGRNDANPAVESVDQSASVTAGAAHAGADGAADVCDDRRGSRSSQA